MEDAIANTSKQDARKQYLKERYHRTKEQALDYMAHKHAHAILEMLQDSEPTACEEEIALYLKEHCKFRNT